MADQQIRTCMLYEFKLQHNATQAAENINVAWGEGSTNVRTTQRWFKKFRDDDFSLVNEDRGRPISHLSEDCLQAAVEENTRKSVRELAQDLNVSKSTVSVHLKKIGKVKKLDSWVPHELTEGQQKARYEICSSLIIRNENDPFLSRIVTCDEKWIAYDNRRRSAQWLDADERPKQMPKPSLHPKKTMITVWWSAAGVIHYDFLKHGETITAQSYCQQIETMHRKLLDTQPGLVNRKGPILLHDNARPHVSKMTVQKLHELKYEILPHPAYSPDLSPTDYHLFKHMDAFLVDKRFRDHGSIQQDIAKFFESRSQEFYKVGINKLLSRWQKCLNCDGKYFI